MADVVADICARGDDHALRVDHKRAAIGLNAAETGEVDIGQLVAVANAMLGDVDVWQQRMKKQSKRVSANSSHGE